ncbi:MAG: double-strand break repair helicase AddA [Proteobacteria bacterium]|nr:double-strand break repair helicase AddA [Pseudomonadota bacterium]
MTPPVSRKQSAIENPNVMQSQASDPLRSVWVGASAGTGKTKVLIDRVLRLMLPRSGLPRESATLPGKVLCLTFTKTAAAEMSNRIYESLSRWSVSGDAALDRELEGLIGTEPTAEVREEARRLFARVLDTPGGLKIMTIHSFCQSVLKRFPVEAGLPPHFQLMDEQSAIEYLTKCLHNIIAEARKNSDSVLAQSFNHLTLHLDSGAMSDLMQQIMSKRSLLTEIFKHHGDVEGSAAKTIQAVYHHLGTDESVTERDILSRAGRLTDAEESRLRLALLALLGGSKKDIEKVAFIQPWLEQPARRGELLPLYCQGFFTKEGEIFKTLATKSAVAIYPDIVEVMQAEAERLEKLQVERQSVRLAQLNAALLTVAAAMVGRYARYKKFRDTLDFDDLIIKTCELLAEENIVPWVLFKLDEGIDHILVDEAQDTSRHQWRVIEALSEDFFSGRGTREDTQRTLFVVGDEKQSIFSFQGADPYEFARMQKFFGTRVNELQEGWEVFLEYSFRSTRAVLEMVDGVFSNAHIRKGVVFSLEREIRHLPSRLGQAGLVELWPLVKTAVKEKNTPWQLPTEIDAGDSAAGRLARQIAVTIKSWLDKKEVLASRGRPIRAGDVMILVQSRSIFVELLMRSLKSMGVPVAGVDRMVLTEEIAVMDLLALAQFALLPEDDLMLANLLKSPLVGFSEEELYQLCYQRKHSLWAVVREKNPALASWLRGKIVKAGRVTPYEFFAEVLTTPCFADPVSGRRAFYSRLGFDIQDALDEFLNSCLHYEQSHTPSLQKFIDWFSRGEAEIKREQERGGADLVRIMTVHGSKGLQAPIVFLPDTVKKAHDHSRGRVRLLWPEDETGVPLWSSRAEFDAPIYAAQQKAAQERQEEEYRRLLYVALTRAEDRLYICGYHGAKKAKPDCWYHLVADAFPSHARQIESGVSEDGEVLYTRRLEHQQEAAPEKEKDLKEKSATVQAPLPTWVGRAPAEEPSPPQPLTPSRPHDDEPAVKGPLTAAEGWRFSRGLIVHQILEILPQLPPERWEVTLARYLARPRLGMPPEQQSSFAREILAVLRHPEFSAIFGQGSRAEVPVVGLTADKILSGQMDRVLVTDKEILVVDYKTNRPPPHLVEDVPAIYLKQMAAYRSVIQNIYPHHQVRCALLWTDGPLLMPLSDNILDSYKP